MDTENDRVRILLEVQQQEISFPAGMPHLVAGTAGVYRVQVQYDDEWENAPIRVIVFDGGSGNSRISVLDTGGEIEIPPESIAVGGAYHTLRFGVLGCDGTGALRITTCAMRDGLRIDPAGATTEDVPQEQPAPTPGLWEGIITAVGDLRELQTTDQSSLVAAINEALQGTGGVSDHAQLSSRSAADQHPIGAISGLQDALDGKQSTTITDEGGYFVSDTVEGVLQELGAALGDTDTALDSILTLIGGETI